MLFTSFQLSETTYEQSILVLVWFQNADVDDLNNTKVKIVEERKKGTRKHGSGNAFISPEGELKYSTKDDETGNRWISGSLQVAAKLTITM